VSPPASHEVIALPVRSEDDVLVVRQRTRKLAALCGAHHQEYAVIHGE